MYIYNADSLEDWDLSSAKTVQAMFSECHFMKKPSLGRWNISAVTDMSYFLAKSSLNPEMGQWDVSKVERAEGCFYKNRTFNRDISEWDISSLQNASSMFHGASGLKCDLSKWNLENIRHKTKMFEP